MQRKVSESALSAARATKMTQRESRVAWQLWLGMVLFLASSVASVGVAQTALGGLFWDCQTNGSDGGHASTQAQAVENWLARMNGFFYAGPCGALGTSQYRNCPIYNGGTSQGSMDVPLICPYGGAPTLLRGGLIASAAESFRFTSKPRFSYSSLQTRAIHLSTPTLDLPAVKVGSRLSPRVPFWPVQLRAMRTGCVH